MLHMRVHVQNLANLQTWSFGCLVSGQLFGVLLLGSLSLLFIWSLKNQDQPFDIKHCRYLFFLVQLLPHLPDSLQHNSLRKIPWHEHEFRESTLAEAVPWQCLRSCSLGLPPSLLLSSHLVSRSIQVCRKEYSFKYWGSWINTTWRNTGILPMNMK